jgi:hypothetical protein
LIFVARWLSQRRRVTARGPSLLRGTIETGGLDLQSDFARRLDSFSSTFLANLDLGDSTKLYPRFPRLELDEVYLVR